MGSTDYLVIGSGLAGLSFALRAAASGRVTVITKDRLAEGASSYAQGGIASVWSPEDSFEAHVADTLAAGAGLCHPDVVALAVREAPARVRDLIALGTHFSTRQDGDAIEYDLGREGGHSRRRILHAEDLTGQEIMRALTAAVQQVPAITVHERQTAIDLCVVPPRGAGEAPACWGALVLDLSTGAVRHIAARATVLATGGAGKVYLYTTNPDIATGDGIAMAFRAGAAIANMEFFQFHPTCLYHPQAKSFLISEALRGEGAILRRPDGTAFMAGHHPQAELAPRDIVARAIDAEMKAHGFPCVYLDIRPRGAEFIRRRFPHIHTRCQEFGIDITQDPIPVVPAAHYCCGGIVTDTDGATTLPRLYACGEVAMTGLHGGNRLASNSLLEAVVFGHRAAHHAARLLAAEPQSAPVETPPSARKLGVTGEVVGVSQNWQALRRLMWNYVGVVRSERRLARAAERIRLIRAEAEEDFDAGPLSGDVVEMRQLATVADLIVTAARYRRESRGLHFLTDYPETDDATWRRDTLLCCDAQGRVVARRGSAVA